MTGPALPRWIGAAALRRWAGALAAAITLAPAAAVAVGTDGVELNPQLRRGPDGRFVLEVAEDPVEAVVLVENLTATPKRIRVYATSAGLTPDGGVQLGGPGSADWLGLADRVVALGPDSQETLRFRVDPSRLPRSGPRALHAALVLESRQGDTLVTRAASVVRVGPPAPGPARWPWILFAVALLVLVASGQVRHASRRLGRGRWRRDPS